LLVDKKQTALSAEKTYLINKTADLSKIFLFEIAEKTEAQKKRDAQFFTPKAVVQIPEVEPFFILIKKCTIIPAIYSPSHLVGISDVASKCAKIVQKHILSKS
jgi:hypothetical protein